MDDKYMLQLSTEVAPPKMFTVDGAEYHMLGLNHMSETTEAEVMALFQRFSLINDALERARREADAEKFAAALRKMRIRILTKLTDMPEEVAAKLPLPAQTKLIMALRAEVDGEELPAEVDEADALLGTNQEEKSGPESDADLLA